MGVRRRLLGCAKGSCAGSGEPWGWSQQVPSIPCPNSPQPLPSGARSVPPPSPSSLLAEPWGAQAMPAAQALPVPGAVPSQPPPAEGAQATLEKALSKRSHPQALPSVSRYANCVLQTGAAAQWGGGRRGWGRRAGGALGRRWAGGKSQGYPCLPRVSAVPVSLPWGSQPH